MAAVAVPLIVVGWEQLLAVLGIGAVAAGVAVMSTGREATPEETAALATASATRVGGKGCEHQFSRSKDVNFICQQLGLDRRSCGNALHRVKNDNKGFLAGDGKRRNPDVSICLKCGLVVEASSMEELGYLE